MKILPYNDAIISISLLSRQLKKLVLVCQEIAFDSKQILGSSLASNIFDTKKHSTRMSEK